MLPMPVEMGWPHHAHCTGAKRLCARKNVSASLARE
jgi:hypothetical protein